MFQLEFADYRTWNTEPKFAGEAPQVVRDDIKQVLFMHWEEHCVECGFPECYSSCSLYRPRKDGNCSRFSYGIIPNFDFKGHFNFGADIRFRKWSKIEANLAMSFSVPLLSHRLLLVYQKFPRSLKSNIRAVLGGKYQFDEFLIECYSPEEKEFNLLLDFFTEQNNSRKLKFRHLLRIKTGRNLFRIPFQSFNIETLEGYINLYQEDDSIERRLVFTWLDFVKYKIGVSLDKIHVSPAANKVKCVAWDLDNTIWKGVISEENVIKPKKSALKAIKRLDEMGIIQTVVSKNDFDTAYDKLTKLGIAHFFLHPAINWGQKSQNLAEIARKLNINPDSFAVIDDSPFERAELKKELPTVRVYTEKEIPQLFSYEEFNIPITETSKIRRTSYLEEAGRNETMVTFSGSYEEFLLSCNMVLGVFCPDNNADIMRCWELIQRSNQLNLSCRRYSKDQFNKLLQEKNILPIAFKCSDRFGNYGIIGYSTVSLSNDYAVIEDFVLSCRVAQKKVEHSFFEALSSFLFTNGYQQLRINLVKTEKNAPLQQSLYDLNFDMLTTNDNSVILKADLKRKVSQQAICRVEWDENIGLRYQNILSCLF